MKASSLHKNIDVVTAEAYHFTTVSNDNYDTPACHFTTVHYDHNYYGSTDVCIDFTTVHILKRPQLKCTDACSGS